MNSFSKSNCTGSDRQRIYHLLSIIDGVINFLMGFVIEKSLERLI